MIVSIPRTIVHRLAEAKRLWRKPKFPAPPARAPKESLLSAWVAMWEGQADLVVRTFDPRSNQ
jgi:hypothetical protein